ncbi:hypothetical protein [Alteromonas sp. BMJM2]|uniref:hypothetical protein n=1 Tax=Alteromonas sp. BMJM2 TaxID=2954241 RepID=UPI0022B2B151|nr:hypothetical protein [Alteromonas sp. BMJM2]
MKLKPATKKCLQIDLYKMIRQQGPEYQLFSSRNVTNDMLSIEAPNVGIGFFSNMDDNEKTFYFGHGGADAHFMPKRYV